MIWIIISNVTESQVISETNSMKKTLHYWSELQEIRIPTVEIIHNQTIWENRYITISNRPYIWSNWAAKGIVQIHDIIKENGDFLNHSEIKKKYDINSHIRHSRAGRTLLRWRKECGRLWVQLASAVQAPMRSVAYICTLILINFYQWHQAL